MEVARGRNRGTAAAAVVSLLWSIGGCTFGPKALERSHGPYYEAVRLVSEEELLRNIVHMRYNESPSSLGVSSIAAQYELNAGAEARPFFSTEADSAIFKSFSTVLPDLSVGAANRPTLTLDPADDSDAVRQFLTPITADTFVFLVQTNWPVATILRLYVERMNGVPNGLPAQVPPRQAVPDFARFLRIAELLQTGQDQELLSVHAEDRITEVGGPLPAREVTAAALVEAAKNGLEYRPVGDGKAWALIRRERRLVIQVTPDAVGSPELVELAQLLNLVPGLPRYELLFVARGFPDPLKHPSPPVAELRVVPRSTAQVYGHMANGVEVPLEHLACGLVPTPIDADGKAFDGREITRGLFEIHTCKGHKPPPNAYVAVKYRGYWYYLDDADAASKATFALMLQLSRLDFGRQRLGSKPVLTLPVGR
jgi:hypothetical protein